MAILDAPFLSLSAWIASMVISKYDIFCCSVEAELIVVLDVQWGDANGMKTNCSRKSGTMLKVNE